LPTTRRPWSDRGLQAMARLDSSRVTILSAVRTKIREVCVRTASTWKIARAPFHRRSIPSGSGDSDCREYRVLPARYFRRNQIRSTKKRRCVCGNQPSPSFDPEAAEGRRSRNV
jgi:hypothetical protein